MKRWTIGVMVVALAAGAAMAGDGWGGKGTLRDISRADFIKAAETRFDAMDANKDGVVTQAERQAAWKTHAGQFKPRGDVTESQYLEMAKARFQRMDADKNGVLSAEERQGGRHGMRDGRFHHAGMMLRGDVTRADFIKHVESRFDALDTDKNGVVTVAEFQAGRPHRKAPVSN
ncbi:EF-hand domain-containing protein [Chitiniphilus eburneus]|uniref:EF-hand domain-containing protein n=1 Tax=Chitiniphilus eburneus TaxID=2571148 RepID=A0A4U0PX81_9NEIS|nr:hypothetical protein [Chitiniphilus eburneus]TJZ73171.1 hypothetical protein FAZ21_11165 [Chitiniphilus eburneus]